MRKPRPTSVVILITLAELAWLAAFGLLFAYRGKVGELGVAKGLYQQATNQLSQVTKALTVATNELTWWRTNAPEKAKLVAQLKAAKDALQESNAVITNLQAQVAAFNKYLRGKSPEEVGRILVSAQGAAERVRAAEEKVKKATNELALANAKQDETNSQLEATKHALAGLKRKWDELPPNVGEVAKILREATNKVASLETELRNARAEIARLNKLNWTLNEGEIAIRRELIGLPAKPLQRVIFVVDTSSSMRNDTNVWKNSKKLMETWMEHLAVEECALVNFNDDAFPFPKTGYWPVRNPGTGNLLTNKMATFLDEFDRSKPGDYSDMLAGLKEAYKRPNADLIVLFSDGRPQLRDKPGRAYPNSILAQVRQRTNIPILAVAVGSYDKEGVAFLKQLAKSTGGNFIGR